MQNGQSHQKDSQLFTDIIHFFFLKLKLRFKLEHRQVVSTFQIFQFSIGIFKIRIDYHIFNNKIYNRIHIYEQIRQHQMINTIYCYYIQTYIHRKRKKKTDKYNKHSHTYTNTRCTHSHLQSNIQTHKIGNTACSVSKICTLNQRYRKIA